MAKNTPKMSGRTLSVLVALLVCVSSRAYADLEEVTFQSGDFNPALLNSTNPGGPAPVAFSGDFFFDTTTVTGGLRSVFDKPGTQPPGAPGTANVSFAAGPAGGLMVTYANGAMLTMPFTSGFSLGNLFDPCGPFGDCAWSVGQVLTLDQFKAAPDPWALILNGVVGITDEFFPFVSAISPGSGHWNVQAMTTFEIHPVPVPEPAMLSLLGLGLVGVGFMRRRKKS